MASILAANALTTYAQLLAELAMSDTVGNQAILERLINVASDAVDRYCGRVLAAGTQVETLEPTGTNRLVLERTPLISITSIKDDGETIDASDYAIEDAERGFVWRDTVWAQNEEITGIAREGRPGTSERTLVATYVGGFKTATYVAAHSGDNPAPTRDQPYDLEQACIDIAVSLYRRRGADRQAAAYDQDNIAIGRGGGGVIPGSLLPILNRYRRIA